MIKLSLILTLAAALAATSCGDTTTIGPSPVVTVEPVIPSPDTPAGIFRTISPPLCQRFGGPLCGVGTAQE